MKILKSSVEKIITAEIEHENGEHYDFWWKWDGENNFFSIVQKRGGVVILEGTPLYEEIRLFVCLTEPHYEDS